MDLNDINSFLKVNDQMNESLKSFSSLQDYTIGSSVSEFIKMHEQMALALKPISPLQEYASSFSKLNDQMARLLSPFSSLREYSIDSSLNEFTKIHEQMALALKPISPLQEYASSFSKLNDQINESLKSFSSLQNYTIGSDIIKLIKEQTQFGSIKSLMDSIGSLHNTMNMSSYFDSINDVSQQLDFSSWKIEEAVEKEFELQIESLPENKKVLDEIFIALVKSFPQIKNIQEAYNDKKYVQLITYFIFFIIPLVAFYTDLYSKIYVPMTLYKINRDNVRIRTEPTTNNPSSIITKLNKNIHVFKIDAHKNWIKVEFENNHGEVQEGWVRNDMLTKIEQK